MTVPAKGQYTIIDLKRHADMYGVEFVPNRFFPINTLTLMRAAVAIQLYHPERFDDFLKAIFTALWVKGKTWETSKFCRKPWLLPSLMRQKSKSGLVRRKLRIF